MVKTIRESMNKGTKQSWKILREYKLIKQICWQLTNLKSVITNQNSNVRNELNECLIWKMVDGICVSVAYVLVWGS